MIKHPQFELISTFPDFRAPGFHEESYNRQFKEKNVLIHASAREVFYSEHWGPLSIKTAFNGKEFYKLNNCELAVDEKNYLLINSGNFYSSYINSSHKVESFSINFSSALIKDAATACFANHEFLLDNFNYNNYSTEFYERLSLHDNIISPHIFKLKNLASAFSKNISAIEESYLLLLEKIVQKQMQFEQETLNVPVSKTSTKKELYRRLMRSKDFIDTCYCKNITIEELANVSFLNQTYFLRQFKKYFGITPRQYIIGKRMKAVKEQLETDCGISITEVCFNVGYTDLSSFSKLFKRTYALSPETFRRRKFVHSKFAQQKE